MSGNNFNPKIRNTADKVKKTSVLFKGAVVVLVSLLVLTSVTYLVSYFYDRFSSFTVSLTDYDMIRQGLTLSETTDFNKPTPRLVADAIKNCTNISGNDLPQNIDMINGEHNGRNYIAYTYYLMNSGKDTVTYKYGIYLSNVTNGIDEAVRFKLYVDGEPEVFAKTKSDGSGPEDGTTEFLTKSAVVEREIKDFRPGDVTKFTVVVWLEGDDPNCVDDIIGGRFKAEMRMSIIEGS